MDTEKMWWNTNVHELWKWEPECVSIPWPLGMFAILCKNY